MVIIYANFVKLQSSVLNAKSPNHQTSGSEEDIFKRASL